ncbi:MAG: CotH kinase family protein, partial [Lachnospiraceae bacterium]|nr:CotH kinase family protein [Lachnospiraceae bacterium]
PANYNLRGREAERPVFVELFDQNGQLILSQNAGIRTFGGWSRASDQKSFKLFARNVYEQGKGTFDFDFFPENTTYYGRAITDYSRLVLRNNGNDNPFGFLRDNTVSALASAILPDTQSTRPAAVFLNGAYYGFVWIHQVYHADYFDDHNEIKNGEWAIVEGGENWKSADPLEPLEVKAVEDYEEMYRYHEWDLTDDDIFAAFCELVDIENFLAYYAVQIYANNNDWPWGNYKAYRYYGEADSLINDGISTADGKWRWLLYDTDWTLGLYNSKASDLTLAKLLGVVRSDRLSSPLLISILERDDMKNRFITILCDIMNYHFSPQNIEHKVRLKEAERINELTHNFKVGGAALKNTWSSLDFVSGQLESMIEFGNKRPAEMQKQIEKYLEVGPTGYIINVKAHDLTDIKLSTINITEDFSGFYYFDNVVTVKADRPVGYDFSHWLVNGDIITDEILSVSKYTVENGEVNIELALKKAEVRMPVITLIDYKGSRDYIEIFNPYEQDIDLRNFFISDDPERPFRQIIAPYLLKPGERKMIYCENHQNAESFGGIKLDFSLKSGETLIITDKRGELVYELFLPDIDSGYILSLDMRNGNYIGKKRT